MKTRADKTQEVKSQAVANSVTQKKDGTASTFQFMKNRPEAIAQWKLHEMLNNSSRGILLRALQEKANQSPQAQQLVQSQAMANNHSGQHQQPVQMKNKDASASAGSAVARSEGRDVSSPIQMVKIQVDGLEYETNGKSYEELVSLRQRVASQDQAKLELAIRAAHAMDLREPSPLISGNSGSGSGLRRRAARPAVPQSAPAPDEPVFAPPTPFATVHGPTAHGPAAWASTGTSILTGKPDMAALRNSSADTKSMASRTVRDVRKGNLKDAAISATQGVLSGGQVVLSTPVAHVLNHGAAAIVGSPVPVPVADGIWYPANWAKEGLEKLRDPKEKTK